MTDQSQFIIAHSWSHECHAVTTRTMNTTWWPWDSHGEIKRFPLGECPIWPAPHHKRFLVVSPWRFCYHEESRGLTMRFFWSPREIFWWIKIFTCPHTKSFLMVSPWDSLCHHEESRSLTVRFFWSPRGIFWWMKIFYLPPYQKLPRGLAVRFFWSPQAIFR